MTAQKLWDILVEDHKHSEDFLKVFQACTCDHFAEDKATYQTLLQKVTLIMYYIVFDNQLVQDYMASWINLNEQWPYKFMESVLLRLLCIAKLNACRFHYDLQFDTSDTDEMNTPVNQDAIFTSEEFIVINNQYYGMYRFQTEMDASVTDHNAIFSIPETQSGMVKLFSVINKLEAVYQTARFIPLVLMQDNWMALLLSRGIKMRSIRQDYNDRLVNNLHKMYYQG
uniref:Uncharacterized protein n=1 Tax=Anopheles maculatus TaxID=74869 RepID=A0A182SSY7_9DIPT